MEFSLSSKPLTVGRGEGNTIILKDKSVSQNHARIVLRQGAITVKDMNSSNGVMVNGERIPEGKPYQISAGDEIKIGIYLFSLVEGAEGEEIEQTILTPMDTKEHIDEETNEVEEGEKEEEKEEEEERTAAGMAEELQAGDELETGQSMPGITGESFEETGTDTGEETHCPEEELQTGQQGEAPDDDMTGEDSTMLVGGDSSAFQVAKLVVIEGEEVGRDYLINRDVLAIGRDEGNDIVLNDSLVSRRHALVMRHDEGEATIRDAGSANGIYVNKRKTEESLLSAGDVITVGMTRFRYVGKGEVFSFQEKDRTDKSVLAIVKKVPRPVLIGGAIVILLLVFLMMLPSEKQDPAPVKEPAKTVQESVPRDDKALESFLASGTQLLKSQSWSEAIDEYNRVLAIDNRNSEAQRLKEEAERELHNYDTFKMAQIYAVDGKYEEALGTLGKIPEESYYFQKAGEERELVQKEWSGVYIADGRDLLEKSNYKEAIAKFEQARVIDPENTDAQKLIDEANNKLRRDLKPKTKARAPVPTRKKTNTIATALREYSRGKAGAALSMLKKIRKSGNTQQAERAAAYVQLIDRAEKSFSAGLSLYQKKNIEGAFAEWKKTLIHEKDLPLEGKSAYAKQIAGAAADELYRQGNDSFNSGNTDQAIKLWKQSIATDPAHTAALSRLEDSAKKLYREGYALEDINRDVAIAKWKEILDIVPPGSEYHDKARAKLSRYNAL